jgi:cell division protease FtsH
MVCQTLDQCTEGDNDQMYLGGEYNEAIADRIDTEVCKIINHCVQIATEIVLDNRVVIDLAVEKLLDAETLDGVEFRNLFENTHFYHRKTNQNNLKIE